MADTPQQPEPAQRQETKSAEIRPRPSSGRRFHALKIVVFLIVLVGVAIGGYRLWNYFESYESTDDAEIDGDIYAVTSRIAGTVKAVYVEDNAQVKAGQLLVELDPRDYEVALDQAKTSLSESRTLVAVARPNVPITNVSTETTLSTSANDIAEARAALAAAQRNYDSALADIRTAEADNVKAQADLARYKILVAKDEISKQQYDAAVASADSTLASLADAQAGVQAAQEAIRVANQREVQSQSSYKYAETGPQQVAAQSARAQQAEAQV